MNKNKDNKGFPKSRVTQAKLSFNDGFAERPFYSIKAFTTEKNKGIGMLELIEDNFCITSKDRADFFDERMKELEKDMEERRVDWTKDEKGNIASPFRSRKWKDSK